jgi:hypothetical protein
MVLHISFVFSVFFSFLLYFSLLRFVWYLLPFVDFVIIVHFIFYFSLFPVQHPCFTAFTAFTPHASLCSALHTSLRSLHTAQLTAPTADSHFQHSFEEQLVHQTYGAKEYKS